MSTITASGQRRFKIVVVGEVGVGKTSLVARATTGKFFEQQAPTTGAAFSATSVRLPRGGRRLYMDIWDTAGQERYHCLMPLYYRDAHAALIVLDASAASPHGRLQRWHNELTTAAANIGIVIVVCNKSDGINKQRKHKPDTEHLAQVFEFANSQSMGNVFVVSAKTGANVNELAAYLAQRLDALLSDSDRESDSHQTRDALSIEGTQRLGSNCCCT